MNKNVTTYVLKYMGGPYSFILKHFSVTGPLQDGIIKVFMAVFV